MADTRGPVYNDDILRGAIKRMIPEFDKKVDLTNIVDILWSKDVIDDEQKQEIESYGTKTIKATRRLLTMVVDGEVQVVNFIKVLRNEIPWAWDMVAKGVEKIKSGEWSLHGELDVAEIRRHLEKQYKKDVLVFKLSEDQDLLFRIDDDRMIMTPNFKAYEVNLESEENRYSIHNHQKTAEEKEAYCELPVSVIDNIFRKVNGDQESRALNLQKNLVRLLGDAGVGKTTLVKRLTWLWANRKNELSASYKLLFFISIRKVKEGTVMDILSHLSLLPPSPSPTKQKSLQDRLYEYLSRPENAKQTIFILDGVDESDIRNELHKLIEGQLFTGSTVLMTARPEGKCLKSFSHLPKVKVSLFGTTEDTVEKYIKESVLTQNAEEWNEFKRYYEEKLSDSKLLRIPLYLTLLCFVFKADIAKGVKRTKLRIPQTMTALFNAFMHVLISRWVNRGGERTADEETAIEFENSPLDSDSTVPAGIKRTISSIGQLCFKDLISDKSLYEFSKADASKCFLNMDDIVACGFFTVGNMESAETFFPIHKQIQEYLAGVYLACEGIHQPSFHKLLNETQNQGKSLSQVMRDHNKVKLTQFSCGLSSEFCKQLFDFAVSHFCILKCVYDGRVDVYYETALFAECNIEHLPNCDAHAVKVFIDYLCKASIKCFDNKELYSLLDQSENYAFYHKHLQKVATAFSGEIAVKLLSNLYKIKLQPVSNGQSMCYCLDTGGYDVSNNGLELCMDQLQTELLSHIIIQGVESVTVDYRKAVAYVDLPRILTTFSNIKEISLNCKEYIPYSSNGNPDGKMCSEMRSVKLYSEKECCVPKQHVECISKQEMLAYLNIWNVNILQNKPLEVQNACWMHLKEFHLITKKMLTAPEGFAYCAVLEASSHTLRNVVFEAKGIADAVKEMLMQAFRQLNIVERVSIGHFASSQPLHEILSRSLPKMKNLNALRCSLSSDRAVYNFCEAEQSLKQLTELDMTNVSVGGLELLSSCLPQMRPLLHLSIILNGKLDQVDKFSKAIKSLENLECFKFFPYGESYEAGARVLICLAEMQNLKMLQIDIHVDHDMHSQLCAAFQSLKNLEQLTIKFDVLSKDEDFLLSACLPALIKVEKLCLRNVHVQEKMVLPLSGALQSLPNLKHLHVNGSQKESNCVDKVLTDCLPHMSSQILSFEILAKSVCQAILFQFCDAVKSLKKLEYLSCGSGTAGFAVTVITDCVPHLPKLETLSLNTISVKDSLLEISDALCKSNSLRTMYLWGRQIKYPPDFMHRLHERGVKVSVERGPNMFW